MAGPLDKNLYNLIQQDTYEADEEIVKCQEATDCVTIFTREGGNAYRSNKLGNLLDCSFYMTSNAYPYTGEGASSCTPYAMLFIGWQSVGVAGFSGLIANYNTGFGAGEYSVETGNFRKPIEIIVRGLGETGFDPLKQRGTVGWLLSHTATVLNSAWIRNLQHANMGS